MSIITKAANLNRHTVLVFGEQETGQAAYMRFQALNLTMPDDPVLWIAFGGLAFKENIPDDAVDRVNNWDAVQVSSWESLSTDVITPIRKGELKYKVVVLDGLHVASKFCLAKIAPTGKPTQSDWGEMGNTMRNMIVQLRDNVPNLICSVDVIPDDTGTLAIAFNRDLYNQIMPFFTKKVYTSAAPIKDVKTGVITDVAYTAQENALLALKLKAAAK